MALELIPVEPPTIFLAMKYMSHLLLPFAFYWTSNLATSYQKPYARGRQSKTCNRSFNKAPKAVPLPTLSCHFSITVIRQCCES